MKAFEKEYPKPEWDKTKPFLSQFCYAMWINQKRVWDEALKMVMRHEMHRYGNDFITDEPMNVLYDFIRVELEQ